MSHLPTVMLPVLFPLLTRPAKAHVYVLGLNPRTPSKPTDAGQPYRMVVDWTLFRVRLVARWLKRRHLVLIGDGSYACIHLGRP